MKPAKRARIEFEPASTSYTILKPPRPAKIEQTADIFRLNDDCFEAIFKWLCAVDLPALHETCVRIQNLVKVYFGRRYANKRAEIARINGIVAVKKYGELKDVIQNVSFRGMAKQRWPKWMTKQYTHDDIDLLMYYVHSQCNEYPKVLRFENMILEEKEGKIMDKVLGRVEVIEFVNCESEEFYQYVLKRSTNIKSLTVKQCAFPNGHGVASPWLQQRYPLLEHLDIQLDGTSSHLELDVFMQRNPQIKKFTCRSRLCSYLSKIQNVMNAIAALDLEELFLTVGGDCDFRSIYAQLLDISGRQQFRRLSLEFGSADVKDVFIDNLNNLAGIDKLYALHITNVDFAKDLPTNIDMLMNLKELHLNNLANCDYSARMIANVTPNLELLIVRNSCYFTPSVVNFIQPFIECLPKLKKIVLAHDVWPRINHQLAFLNGKRQQLHGACMVIIWTQPPKAGLKDTPKLTGKILIRMRPLYDEYEHL
ncbi:uncharacterized protein LOC129577611 [Sitodiplosis mosellana]|uniref:uncharacterized protein LOC129577611 n=1 Tax=Sitodiplosis mosellana TaxID=263140 RepID=UPI002443F011|nr:uncharacterized protein LOC129577611 [Sitodiplosis mosellana]